MYLYIQSLAVKHCPSFLYGLHILFRLGYQLVEHCHLVAIRQQGCQVGLFLLVRQQGGKAFLRHRHQFRQVKRFEQAGGKAL